MTHPRFASITTPLLGALALVTVVLGGAPASAQDSDADGVPDRYDRCRLTPAGAPVDPAGCAAECDARVVLGEAFGRTLLTEIGLNARGAFGTTNGAPDPYHPRPELMSTARNLGFVADPDRSDWTTYRGDYFYPGTPEEGWGLSFGSAADGISRNNNTAGAQEIPGEIVEATCVPSGLCGPRGGARIVWRGTDLSGLIVEQEAIVLHEGLFILINVAITNPDEEPVSNVYYIRNVDPDNNQPVHSEFTTRNTIVSQFPPLGTGTQALVTALQSPALSPMMMEETFLALASRSPSAVVSRGGFSNRDARAAHVGEAPHVIMEGSTLDGDEAVSIAFSFPRIAGRETVRFTYLYVLGVSAIDDALLCAADDSDFDGVPDARDVDDDNDGVPDALEVVGFRSDPGADDDGDGVPNWQDPNSVPVDCVDILPPSGVCDTLPAAIDADRDGIPNHLDLDTDGDGLTDTRESGGVDTTGQGRPDECLSVDAVGGCVRPDGSSLSIISLRETDLREPPDLFDLDSDQDGTLDTVEAFDLDGDGVADTTPSGHDHDGDGIDDAFDPDCASSPVGCRAMGDPVVEPLAAHRDANGNGVGDWLEVCGDGYVSRFEVCDTGVATDTCSSMCLRGGMQPCELDRECDSGICDGTTSTCDSCVDTTVGGVDLGCTDARPICVGGGTSCEPCDDSASGAEVDEGCSFEAPECDVTTRLCGPCTDPVLCPPSTPDAGMPGVDGGVDGGTGADAGAADGGMPSVDAGRLDAGMPDASSSPDAGPPSGTVSGSGLRCAASPRGGPAPLGLLTVLALGWALRRRGR